MAEQDQEVEPHVVEIPGYLYEVAEQITPHHVRQSGIVGHTEAVVRNKFLAALRESRAAARPGVKIEWVCRIRNIAFPLPEDWSLDMLPDLHEGVERLPDSYTTLRLDFFYGPERGQGTDGDADGVGEPGAPADAGGEQAGGSVVDGGEPRHHEPGEEGQEP